MNRPHIYAVEWDEPTSYPLRGMGWTDLISTPWNGMNRPHIHAVEWDEPTSYRLFSYPASLDIDSHVLPVWTLLVTLSRSPLILPVWIQSDCSHILPVWISTLMSCQFGHCLSPSVDPLLSCQFGYRATVLIPTLWIRDDSDSHIHSLFFPSFIILTTLRAFPIITSIANLASLKRHKFQMGNPCGYVSSPSPYRSVSDPKQLHCQIGKAGPATERQWQVGYLLFFTPFVSRALCKIKWLLNSSSPYSPQSLRPTIWLLMTINHLVINPFAPLTFTVTYSSSIKNRFWPVP